MNSCVECRGENENSAWWWQCGFGQASFTRTIASGRGSNRDAPVSGSNTGAGCSSERDHSRRAPSARRS